MFVVDTAVETVLSNVVVVFNDLLLDALRHVPVWIEIGAKDAFFLLKLTLFFQLRFCCLDRKLGDSDCTVEVAAGIVDLFLGLLPLFLN